MLVDAHQHFWRFDPVRDSWITPEMAVLRRDYLPPELLSLMRENGVGGTVAVQADQSENETRFLLEIADEHPSVLGVVGWVDLLSSQVVERLEHFSQHARFRGVRHVAQAEPHDFLRRPEVIRGIGELRRFGLTYDVLVYPHQLPAALHLVQELPEQPFVVDHLAKPLIAEGRLEPWASQMMEMGRCANAWCKVSGLVTEADWTGWQREDFRPYLDLVLEAFGPDRLMFGSDWPVCLLAAEYKEVVDLAEDFFSQLSTEERARIFGVNAMDFYGLSA